MSKNKKKVKEFSSILDTCYTDWLGQRDTFECEVCGEDLEYPQRKCPYCGSTFKYDHAVLKLVRPVVAKRVDPISYTMPSGAQVDNDTGEGSDGHHYFPHYRVKPTPEPLPRWSFKIWWSSSKGWRNWIP